MTSTVREQFWRLAAELGMTTVFGNPGSTEMTYLSDFPPELTYVLGLHEGAITSVADGFAQVTGRPVLVNLHTAPGVGNAMGALLTARDSHAPLVLTAGNQKRSMLTARSWLVNDEPTVLPRPAVKFAFEPPRPHDVPSALARATSLAMSPPRGPVLLSLPMDDFDAPMDEGPVGDLAARAVHTRAAPDPARLRAVADAIDSARAPVLVLGAAADSAGARDDAVRVARRQQVPVWVAPSSGRSVFPTDSPLFAGYLPFAAEPLAEALASYDLVVVIGAPVFTYYPDVPARAVRSGTRLVQIDDDPDTLARAPLGDALLGDPGLAMAGLRAYLEERPPSSRPSPPAALTPAQPDAAEPGERLTAAAVFAALGPALPPRLRITEESPSNLSEFHRYVPVTFSPCGYLTTPNGGLGYGLPAAVGAALADPATPVLAVIGDGSLHYTGQALWTAARHGANVTVLVLANDAYSILESFGSFEQVSGVPGLDIPGLDAVSYARAYGVPGLRVDGGPVAVRDAVLDAIAAVGPRLLEVPIDTTASPLL